MSSVELVTSKSCKVKFRFCQVVNKIFTCHNTGLAPRPSLCKSYGGYGPHNYVPHMDLAMMFPADGVSSYRVSCYVSHNHASEDAVFSNGFLFKLAWVPALEADAGLSDKFLTY